VIVGGMLRGFVRARRISEAYVLAYFVVGVALILIAVLLFGRPFDPVELICTLSFGHFWLTGFLFPMAVAANLLFVRVFPKRTWRGERWRSWVGGGLGVVLTWGGMLFLGFVHDRPPQVFRDLFGGAATFVQLAGWFILFSNLGLFLAWLLPSNHQ
jgi:hypothetical protein